MKLDIYENYDEFDDYTETYEKFSHNKPKFS